MAVSKTKLRELRRVLGDPVRHGLKFTGEEQKALEIVNIHDDYRLKLFYEERNGMAEAILKRAKQAA